MKKRLLKFRTTESLLAGALMAAASMMGFSGSAHAAAFDTGASGGTVNVPGDYATLGAAAAAFNALSGGIQGDWTVLLTDTLQTEPNLQFWGNFTNGKTVTFKPAPGVITTISLASATSPPSASIFGQWCFGVNRSNSVAPTVADCPATTNGFVIDGNNGTSPGTRHLTIMGPSADTTNFMVTVFGNTKGFVFKNTNFLVRDTGGVTGALRFAGGLLDTTVPANPSFGVVQDCFISSTFSGNGEGIYSTNAASGTMPLGTAIEGALITGNTIIGSQRPIFLNGFASATIKNNHITIVPKSGGITHTGIFFFNQQNVPNNSVISENYINISATHTTGLQGVQGFQFDPASGTVNSSGTLVIKNNIVITNPIKASAANNAQRNQGILLVNPQITAVIEHNSFLLADNPLLATTAPAGYIAAVQLASQFTTGSAIVRNNLISILQTGSANNTQAAIYLGGTSGLTAEGNSIFTASTFVKTGNIGGGLGTPYLTLADWQTAGYDSVASGGQSVNPSAIASPWLTTNLHFITNTLPTGLGAVASSNYLTDYDGEVRPATGATPGADEPHVVLPTGATGNWNLYR